MTNELITTQNELVILEPLPLDRNPAAVYLSQLGSKNSKVTQLKALEIIARLLTSNPDAMACNWAALRFQHTRAIRSRLAERYAIATTNRMLAALRGALRCAWKLGLMEAEDYFRAVDVSDVKGDTLPTGRSLGAGEILALMAACENDPTPAGARDAALLAVLYVGGLRRGEVVTLDLEDYSPESGALTVRHGKGSKQRITYLTNGAARAMADWLEIRGGEPGPLLFPVLKSGKIVNRRLTNQAVYNVLTKRGNQAGVSDFSPHDLRRTFISDLLDAGADISVVAQLAGHSSVNTTQRYDRRPEATKAKAAELLHLPYHGRTS